MTEGALRQWLAYLKRRSWAGLHSIRMSYSEWSSGFARPAWRIRSRFRWWPNFKLAAEWDHLAVPGRRWKLLFMTRMRKIRSGSLALKGINKKRSFLWYCTYWMTSISGTKSTGTNASMIRLEFFCTSIHQTSANWDLLRMDFLSTISMIITVT